MEPFSFILQMVAAAALSAVPAAPSAVPGSIDAVIVSNTTVVSQTATQLIADKAAQEKAATEAAEKVVKEKAEKAAEEVKEKEKAETAKTAEKEHLQLPLKAKSYSYVSDYGLRCAPVTGAGNFHTGIDLAAPTGTPMYSISDGTVVSVTDGSGSVGGDVRIESTVNGKLMTFRYHHMGNSSQYVKVGDKVTAGQHISDVASTGMSTGPHLHLEVFEGEFSKYKHIDPEIYFEEIGLKIIENASANLVDKNDHHPASCPGGNLPLNLASAPQPSSPPAPATPATPATPAAPAAPAPSTPAPAPQRTTPATPAPVATTPAAQPPVPTPSAPAATSSPSPSAISSPTATVSVEVKLP